MSGTWYRIAQLILQLRTTRFSACSSRDLPSHGGIGGIDGGWCYCPYREGVDGRSITANGLISPRYQPFRPLFDLSGTPRNARSGGRGRDARGRGECRARHGPPPEPAQADRQL